MDTLVLTFGEGHSELAQFSRRRKVLRCRELFELCFRPQHTGGLSPGYILQENADRRRKLAVSKVMFWRVAKQTWCTSLKAECNDHKLIDCSKSLLKSLGSHVKEHFPNASYGVYPIEDDSKIAILVVANKYSPNNFW